MSRPRYTVATCTGYLTEKAGRGGDHTPGVTASVLDTACAHREVARFRSEDTLAVRPPLRRGREGAVRAAREYADALNAAT